MVRKREFGWNVAVVSVSRMAGVVLSVFKLRGEEFERGDGDNRPFPSREAAWAWASGHGYVQPRFVS